MSAAIADVLPGRLHYLFDSFEGLPPAKEIDGAAAIAYQRNESHPFYYDNCRANESFAERAMSMSSAQEYRLVKGWFNDTLQRFVPGLPIAMLRLDGDWYDSTIQCLDGLYRHVMPNGLVILDDYYTWVGCARAVHDFLSGIESSARVRNKGSVCFFIKPADEVRTSRTAEGARSHLR